MEKLINDIKLELGCFDSNFYDEIIKIDYLQKSIICKKLLQLNELYLHIDLLSNSQLYEKFINLVVFIYVKSFGKLKADEMHEFFLKQLCKYNFYGIESGLKAQIFINKKIYKKYCFLCNVLPKSIFVVNKIYKNAKKYQYISFDIFDTLVFRPYENPTDLFEHLGGLNNIKDFKELRIRAEQKARELNNFEEINIDEIYLNLSKELEFLKGQEKKLELQVLSSNKRLVKLIDKLKKIGKTIIITSDMYLDRLTIEEILKKNKVVYDYLFLSSEYRKTKHDGTLFKEVINSLNIKNEEILHIGDNEHADYNNAIKFGMGSVFINKYKDDVKLSYCVDNSLIFNIHYHLLKMQKYHNYLEFWEEIGYRYAGVLTLFLANLVSKNADKHKCDSIFFIARDGFLVQKFYRLLNNKLPSFYIYLSRYLANKLKDSVYKEKFSQYIFNKRKNYGKIQMFDIITENFSSQKGLLNFFHNSDLYATYWTVVKDKFKFNFDHALEPDEFICLSIFLVESLISSTTPSIKDFDKNYRPIYGDISEDEKIRCDIYSKITKGALMFAYDVNKYALNKIFINMNTDGIFKYLEEFILNASEEDLAKIKVLKHSSNIANDEFISLDKSFYNYRMKYFRVKRKKSLKYFLKYVFYKYKLKIL